MRGIITFLIGALALCSPVLGQDLSGLARVNVIDSHISESRRSMTLHLALTQGVPYRVYTIDDPARLVLDFKEIDWSGVAPLDLLEGGSGLVVRFGPIRPGWSRMVVLLSQPMLVDQAHMRVNSETGGANLDVILHKADPKAFAAGAGAPKDAQWGPIVPMPFQSVPRAPISEGPVTVVLDPGHGGIDPGALNQGVKEKDLMLIFAHELRDALVRAGGFNVVMTRSDDRFVSLERRVAIAQGAGAHVFLSLHADSLSEGSANGATVHILSDDASDAATARLAERHERADLLAGVDLTGQDDEVTSILLDLARHQNKPRANRLARAIVRQIDQHAGPLHRRPLREASFSVLKSAEIPSVLIELGFLDSETDLSNLIDQEWRGRMINAIRDALQIWVQQEIELSDLVRQ